MYTITKQDIKEAREQCKSAMTVKGQIVGYCIAHGGKDIENRNRKIKNGWYALHVGGSKKTDYPILSTMLESFDSSKMPPTSSIIGVFKIEGQSIDSRWFMGPSGNKITKYIHFDEPITGLPGHQSVTYCLETIDRKLIKKHGSIEKTVREQVMERL